MAPRQQGAGTPPNAHVVQGNAGSKTMIPASEALQRLRIGNGRHVARIRDTMARWTREALLQRQAPFAAILGCADSRVCPELVFDQDPGELFVVRVAGGIATEPEIGSLEYAAAELGVQLIVVLGHSGCGAVRAAMDNSLSGGPAPSAGLAAIFGAIQPHLTSILTCTGTPEELLPAAVHATVCATTKLLPQTSSILASRKERGELVLVGAEYDLATGIVHIHCARA